MNKLLSKLLTNILTLDLTILYYLIKVAVIVKQALFIVYRLLISYLALIVNTIAVTIINLIDLVLTIAFGIVDNTERLLQKEFWL